MHGENEALGNGAPYAGDVIHIKQNSFRSSAQAAIVIRGRPFTGAYVSGNCFAHSGSSTAIRQTNFTGNLSIGSNTYGTTTGACHQTGRRIAWRFSSGGTATYAPLAPYTFDVSEVGFGDFNGDGRTDVFRATGARWYYSPSGTGAFVPLTGGLKKGLRGRFGVYLPPLLESLGPGRSDPRRPQQPDASPARLTQWPPSPLTAASGRWRSRGRGVGR